jgi:hypothetical protein
MMFFILLSLLVTQSDFNSYEFAPSIVQRACLQTYTSDLEDNWIKIIDVPSELFAGSFCFNLSRVAARSPQVQRSRKRFAI